MVLHAAAYKHVPMMEHHPADAVYTNVGGTLAALRASLGGRRRAVRPGLDRQGGRAELASWAPRSAWPSWRSPRSRATRAGATSRSGSGTCSGSSGSVVPLFQRQLREGVPLTITDPEMTRYFMTIPEASRLILEASLLGEPGDLFVLDMGEPVRIVDLARDLARLAGRDPDSVPDPVHRPAAGREAPRVALLRRRDDRADRPPEGPARPRRAPPHPAGVDVLAELDALVAVGATRRPRGRPGGARRRRWPGSSRSPRSRVR